MSIFDLIPKITKQNNDSSLPERALEFAKEAHCGQKRASGEDYIQHPIRVAQILTEMHLDPKAIAAGFLHDVPDDTPKTIKDIEKEFGKEVAFLVEGVSKLGKLRYPKTGWEIKTAKDRLREPIDLRAENLRKMFFAMAQDLRVVLIKLADRLHNMETLGSLPPEKQKRIALETMEIFAPIANRLGMGDIKGKLEDLAFPHLYPKEFEWLMRNVKEKYEEQEKYIRKIRPTFKKILGKEAISVIDIHSRAKHYWSLYQKLQRYDMNFDKIYDLVALRAIVDDVKTCYKILGIIHKLWRPLPGLIKDYIAFPKPNNYRAIHTTCFCLDGKITEFQVKTREMHQEDEYGIASHWAYKEGIDLKTQRRKFAWVQQLRDWQKEVSKSGEFIESLKIDFFKNRIFVFTPKGDVIDLPEGATPVDFAYSVHTEIGQHCSGAKINGKIDNLSRMLQNGDVVEILIDKKKGPSRDWLEFVKTAIARSKIREYLKEKAPEKTLPRAVFPPLLRPEFAEIPLKTRGNSPTIFLAGQTGMQMYLAKCCRPEIGQEIKAYLTKSQGAAVHRADCRNFIKSQKKWPQKIVEASWSNKRWGTTSLEIQAQDRVGLLSDVSLAISRLGINIINCETKTKPGEKSATISAEVEIPKWNDLDRLFRRLHQIKGVKDIKKA
ncbi:MAG: bifunctional (p)ppGpp synthetase/guanosine-3',5'-bis(diphosphate) 3'-pyrophosphohydrolase [Candidatus Nealsonbacteria bacterium]|nr:bifunctional (p)ppGpp synthetase/guanosine-3',5'-bis(diphosphate) 3'-pyrophosphohydrolase [Candidatus Nealsonbacteria bacterium]